MTILIPCIVTIFRLRVNYAWMISLFLLSYSAFIHLNFLYFYIVLFIPLLVSITHNTFHYFLLLFSSLTCSSRSIIPEPMSPFLTENIPRKSVKSERNRNQDLEFKSKNFYIWRIPAEYAPQLHRWIKDQLRD